MYKNKVILGLFWSIVGLILPLSTLAQYVTPSTTGLPTSYDLEDVILNVMLWMLAIFGFLVICVLMFKVTLFAGLCIVNNLGQYNIGGANNSLTKKFDKLVMSASVASPL
jgi:hypothetical protein